MPLSQWAKEPRQKFKTIRDKWKPIMNTRNFWSNLPGIQVVKDCGLSLISMTHIYYLLM